MSKLIMTVDDSESMRQLVRASLTRAGYDTLEAADGETTLDLLSRHPVDLLITDLNMPGMDGIELIRRVRSMPMYRFLPILMLTTESQVSRKKEGREAGASGWILKPFSHEQLARTLQRLLPLTTET